VTVEQYLIFLTITGLFLASPGPAILLCINNGVQYGVKRSAIAVLGNMLAFQILIILSAIGVGSILATSVTIFNLVKFIGVFYLLYLGLKIWFAPFNRIDSTTFTLKDRTSFSLFRHAFLVTASNPKALIYITALLPQFLDIHQALLPQMLILNPAIAILQFAVFMSYVIMANQMRGWLNNETTRTLFNRVTGLIFMGFALALAFSDQQVEAKARV
jgi:homoserine/homoserine lactone efflux protein